MVNSLPRADASAAARGVATRVALGGFALLVCVLGSGCAAFTNPVLDGIPVRRLPPEFLAEPKQDKQTIPLTSLQRAPSEVHRLTDGDLLGIYIESVLGERGQPPPVFAPERTRTTPALGYPTEVRPDGTLHLPLVEPIKVTGMTLAEAEDAIRQAYLARQILQKGRDRVVVTLIRPKHIRVTVVRQESTGFSVANEALAGASKRGTGVVVELPADENDVLRALTLTGGLPGLEAINQIIIQRATPQVGPEMLHEPAVVPAGGIVPGGAQPQTIRIPLRMRPGEPLPFRPEDVVLRNGDVVFIEARDADLFYTGGLLPPGEYILPRDTDLDVVKAVARVKGSLFNGAFSTSNLQGNILNPGIGFPSPSLLTVVREVPGGGTIPIRVDLKRAMRDPRERILVQAGDVLILQESLGEAFSRYTTNVLTLNFVSQFIRRQSLIGTATATLP